MCSFFDFFFFFFFFFDGFDDFLMVLGVLSQLQISCQLHLIELLGLLTGLCYLST